MAAVVALALAGCSPSGSTPSTASSTPVAGGSITVGGLVAGGLDPGVPSFSSQSLGTVAPVFGSLFSSPETPDGEYQPNIAAGYEYSDGGKTLTITMRDGEQFSDGTPLDADAVVWNLQRHIDNSTREKQFFVGVNGIKATDPKTVVITFDQPQNLLLDAMAVSSTGFMASPSAFESMGADAFNAAPVGAGPFKIVSNNPGQQLVMEKNPTYWDADNVYLDGLTYLNTGSDAQSALVSLQADSIQSVDWAGTYTSPAVLSAAEKAGMSLIQGPNTRVLILPINSLAPPFDDIRARQAVSYCMDREAIADSVSQGYATPAFVLSGSDSSALSGWEEGKDLNKLQHDVDKGTALVKELGGLSFSITESISSPVLTALQQQWAECGIDAKINVTPSYLSEVQNGNYQMSFTVNVNAGTNPAASTNYLDPTAANNKFGWRDADITALVDQAKVTTDPAESTKLWHEIWGDLTEQGYIIPVVSAGDYVVSVPELQGVQNLHNFGDYTHAYLTK